jgi:sigma-B regulation protein RsbU (phosphoserine phosphatase)
MKKFKNFSISTKILGISLLLSVLSQLIIVFIAYSHIEKIGNYSQTAANNLGRYSSQSSENALQRQAEEYLTKLSKALADASEVSLNEISGQISGIAAILEEIYKNKNNFNPRKIENFENTILNQPFEKAYIFEDNPSENSKKNDELSLITNAFYTIKPIFSGNPTISAIYFGTESGIKYEFSANSDMHYDPRRRAWYKDAANAKINNNNETVWQNIYEDIVTGNPCITCSKAFCDSNENILGVAAIDIQLESIKNFLKNIKTEATKYAFILDKNGEIIISENDEIKNFGFDNQECESVISNMLSGKNGTEKVILNGAEYYISYSPTKTTGWSVGTINEYNEIIKELIISKNLINSQTAETENIINLNIKAAIEKFFIVFLICMGITLVLGVFMIEKIVHPIRKIKKCLKKIGKGDLNVDLPVETEDEIGELCLAFNKMAKNLKDYIENLAKTTAEKEKSKAN